MIIKATRLQAWAPTAGGGGGKSRPSPHPPSKMKTFFWLYWGPFCYFFFIWEPFHHVGAFFLLFTSWWGPFFELAPLRKFLRAPMIARTVREHAPRKFFCVTTISQFSELWTCFVTILP